MKIKQLLRYTSTLFRTALLFGVIAFVNISAQAQTPTAAQWAEMPDAFETMDPANIIISKDETPQEWYYIQFYNRDHTICSYLTDCGGGQRARTMDFLPYVHNRLWALESAEDNNPSHFKLKSKSGHYLKYMAFGSVYRFACVAGSENASILTFHALDDGYDISEADDEANPMYRPSYGEWVELTKTKKYSNSQSYNLDLFRLRFAKLKSTAAFIIYYRGEHADGEDNNSASATTTRHYLTYSNTDPKSEHTEWNFREGTASSRRSIIPSNKPLCTLPTLAAYHQDGLWQLEEGAATATGSEFYVKKYGSEEYLNAVRKGTDEFFCCDLGTKSDVFGKYTLEDPVANRYTRIQNKSYETRKLDRNMFHDYRNGGDVQGNLQDFHVGDDQMLEANKAVVGNDWMVHYQIYADLTGYTKMIITGTPGMILRVLMNRQTEPDPFDGVERLVTIGSDGRGELDLTEFMYVHLNAIKTSGNSQSGKIYTISIVNQNNVANPSYLNHSYDDGWQVMLWSEQEDNYWYAGFYPVEVPVPNKDNFYQVLVKWSVSGEDRMINHNGGYTTPFPTNEADYDMWQLEMIDDYLHFRLKAPNGRYLKPGGQGMTEPNDPTGAEVNTNEKFWTDFSLTWFYVDPNAVHKEIPVVDESDNLYMVTHKKSYLQQYAQAGLDKQGLATDADDDWWNYDKGTQKTNHFEITHYVKKGNTMTVEFPTVLNSNNDHIFFQRFYHYNDESCDNNLYPDGTDIEGLKAHVSLDTRDDGDVQYFLYKNGMVTGKEPVVKGEVVSGGLAWTDIGRGGYARNVQRRFNFTNSDGKAFTVAVDVSRYTDFTYQKPSTPLKGNLEEPSLTMRYLYYMKDAKEMAANLTKYTEQPGVADATTWKENFTGDDVARDAFLKDDNWYETKIFHFPAKTVAYENGKWVGYRGEFIGLRHIFSDYWVFNDGDPYSTDDNNLVSAVNDKNGGKIEVRIYDPKNTGIRLGGWNPTLANANNGTLKFVDNGVYTEEIENDFKGFYFYDKMAYPNPKTSYGDSRFVVFRYPADGEVDSFGEANEAYIHVYLNNNGTRYQLAQYTLIFDKDAEMIPYISVNGSSYVKDATGNPHGFRDPNKLREAAGEPIAKITFDYPENTTYHYPLNCYTLHDGGTRFVDSNGTLHEWVYNSTEEKWEERTGPSTISSSSPVPLAFDNTNYAFDGDGCNWGSYALVAQKSTVWGNGKLVRPVDVAETYGGYGIDPDAGMQRGFLYIDASEQPGDICAVDFQGEFCAGDKLMCTGWISGSNIVGGYRCPGGITMTVKGENLETGKKETIYRFCPGQCYELDNGTGSDGSTGASQVVWQQFYFEFGTTKKYRRYWMEVNNNCVSSNGGDFMLDNVEVYALVPEVIPEMNTPLCIDKDVSDMKLLKLNIGFDKIIAATNSTEVTEGNGDKKDISFVFLEKDKFLTKFLEELNKAPLNLGIANVEALEDNIESGAYENLITTNSNYKAAYRAAFDISILGDDTKVWDSDPSIPNNLNVTAAVLNYHWSTKFSEMETYSFAKAVNGQGSVFCETDAKSGERFIVINGNYPNKLKWKTDTEYYVIPFTGVVSLSDLYEDFNICSACCKKTEFRLDPPIEILSMEASDVTEDLVVCEGKIPTLVTNLKGYNINGELVSIKGLNFDWWLGNETDLATLDNYHKQKNTAETVRLDDALYILRLYYPDVTSLDGVIPRSSTNTQQTTLHANDPELTKEMIDYLKSLVNAGQLILHQSSISIPAKKADGNNDPYFYLVACPIHDAAFDQALNYETDPANKYVAYFCDQPQGFRIKVGEKAPTLKCGFVPYENGFNSYDYSSVDNAVLSIRLAKAAQFEMVKHGTTADAAVDDPSTANSNDHFLWLPIRNAEVQSTGSTKVIQKSNDYNVYLASTDDPIWDKEISRTMNQTYASLPIFGKIVKLEAINTSGGENSDAQKDANRLCIYFTEYGDTDAEKAKFNVREGYSYTLSLPFKENGTNTCDGTILINVKIVPDYEVWTGGAGNPDWNNDQNWRRADGNTSISTTENPDGSKRNNNELYVSNSLPESSGLYEYTTNYTNYRTAKDRILRKGFAPLYCTHVLMKSNEWGDAPVLYDALDDETATNNHKLTASPFPNLRDTSTPILKFDMQARHYEKWSEVYGSNPDKGRTGDLIAEMYQINSCDEIAFQPGAELRNAHLLNYNNAWVEYQLDMKRWYLLGSPLQGTIAGEWYAPTGTAQQKTTYYENVTFGPGYDRYSPAVYQRSWDKAKAVLYEVGASYSTGDNPDDLALTEGQLPGSVQQGTWSGTDWSTSGADNYLDRLGYKPMSGKKANVAMKGIWSNTYNDATVDYTKGGFSVMVMNNLKGGSNANPAIIRLPKEDKAYDYYQFSQTGADDGGTDTYLSDPENQDKDDVQTNLNRAKNRGRLKTDLLLPEIQNKIQRTETAASRYGDARTYTRVPTVTTNEINNGSVATLPMTLRPISETVSAGISNMGYYLVENPFPCGLNMDQFFAGNTGLVKQYWLLTETGQHLVKYAEEYNEWILPSGSNFTTANAVLAPGQGFFVEATTPGNATTITFNKDMQAQSRYGVPDEGEDFEIIVGTKQVMKTVPVTYDDDDNPDTPEVPLMVDDENNPGSLVQATMEVPEVDNLGNYVVKDITEDVTIYSYVQTADNDKKYSLKARTRGDEANLAGLVITAERGDMQSSALVMQHEQASNDFLPSEDTETFITSDLEHVPTVYTLCGRLATTINSIHDFRSLPIGVESNSDAPCTLTFKGVEMLGDSIAFYDALEQKLTPLKSGMTVSVSGQTQNRYYLVRSLIKEEAAAETHLQIFTEGLTAKVIASTAEPITSVRCYDTAGRLIHSASPQTPEYSFSLPIAGVYIISAETENDRKTIKLMAK